MSNYYEGNFEGSPDVDTWRISISKLWKNKHLLTVEEEQSILNITKKLP